MLGFADLKPVCWLEVSLHPEGPATGQLDHGFPWSQSKCWVGTQIPRCTACFPCSPPNGNIKNFALHQRDYDIGLDHPVYGGYGWGSPTPRRPSNCQTKRLKSGPAPRRTGRQTVGHIVTWNWTCVIALQITDPSSRQKMKNKESNCHSEKCNI
jgi:hypothetical protein